MGLNRRILQKVIEKTKGDSNLQSFIVDVLGKEGDGLSHYSKYYASEITKHTILKEAK